MENPFGHIAIRIRNMVYSANHISNPTKGAPLLQHMSLEEYLFGVQPPSGDQIHTSTYGNAHTAVINAAFESKVLHRHPCSGCMTMQHESKKSSGQGNASGTNTYRIAPILLRVY